jgi:hypothetical protein
VTFINRYIKKENLNKSFFTTRYFNTTYKNISIPNFWLNNLALNLSQEEISLLLIAYKQILFGQYKRFELNGAMESVMKHWFAFFIYRLFQKSKTFDEVCFSLFEFMKTEEFPLKYMMVLPKDKTDWNSIIGDGLCFYS